VAVGQKSWVGLLRLPIILLISIFCRDIKTKQPNQLLESNGRATSVYLLESPAR
jgi:hypothetical protein